MTAPNGSYSPAPMLYVERHGTHYVNETRGVRIDPRPDGWALSYNGHPEGIWPTLTIARQVAYDETRP